MSAPDDNKKISAVVSRPTSTVNELISLGIGATLPDGSVEPVQTLFEKHSKSHPDDIALTYEGKSYSYESLNNWSNRIALRLLAQGIGSEKRVAIMLDASAGMIAAILGVLKSGAAYVPLDTTQPKQRIKSLLADAIVSGAITDNNSSDKLADVDIPNINLAHEPEDTSDAEKNSPIELPSVSTDDPAYMIYTSGSTGEPKGVIIGHRELSNSTSARHMVYPGKSVFLLVSPLSSDSSVAGIWGTLTSGSHLVVASYEQSRDPEALTKLIEKHKVTKILCIPSLYDILLDAIDQANLSSSTSLDTVIVAGETLHQELLKKHFVLLGKKVQLVNEYGPTETTVWASYQRFKFPEPVSIGGPIPGTSLYILDKDQQLTPKGEIGELYIGGVQVAKGYFGRQDATNKSFIADPFTKEVGSRMYRTGDLARWNDAGRLAFVGRKDHQVKIRGHRVELGAVEEVLHSFSEVRGAAVVPNDDHTSLTAFITSSKSVCPDYLRKKLLQELPSFMIPSKIYILDNLPLTNNGKVDRIALAKIEGNPTTSSQQPKHIFNNNTRLAERVAAAWGELLKLDIVPEEVNFFDLGGHSLMVFKLQAALELHTGHRPPVVALFRHTTVSAQAKFISNEVEVSQSQEPNAKASA